MCHSCQFFAIKTYLIVLRNLLQKWKISRVFEGFNLTPVFAWQTISYTKPLEHRSMFAHWFETVEGWFCTHSVEACSETLCPRSHCSNSVFAFLTLKTKAISTNAYDSHTDSLSKESWHFTGLGASYIDSWPTKSCHWLSFTLPAWQRHALNNNAVSCVSSWTTVASSLITTKHNVDCGMTALFSAYKLIILASADFFNRFYRFIFFFCHFWKKNKHFWQS